MMQIEKLRFSYGNRTVLEEITFCAQPGQILSVLGPNGAGKSTLFRCMLGILTPEKGEIAIDGIPIRELSAARLARSVAYIPQSHNPVFRFSVLDMVLMGTTAQLHPFETPGKAQSEQAEFALEQVGIGYLKDRDYSALSGGERQLVLIARALAQQAKWLIMDEPTASLDFGNRIRVMQKLQALAKEGYGIIQSTHDPEQACRYSHKILALQDGRVLAWGEPEAVMTPELIRELYGVDARVEKENDRIRVWAKEEEA